MDEIICGDSVQLLKTVGDETVHLCLCDLSRFIGAGADTVKHRSRPLNGRSEADRKLPAEHYRWCMNFAPEWFRVLKPGASVLVITSGRLWHRCACALEDAGFILRDLLAVLHESGNNRAQSAEGVFRRRGAHEEADKWAGWKLGSLPPGFEPVLWLFKPFKLGGTVTDNLLRHELGAYHETAYKNHARHAQNVLRIHQPEGAHTPHAQEKPAALYRALIELCTRPEHTVLDPFCGAGAVCAACHELGRHYIGIEKDAKACDRARARIAAIDAQTGLETQK